MATSTQRVHKELASRFALKPNQKNTLCGVFILNQIINQNVSLGAFDDTSRALEPLLGWMESHSLIEFKGVELNKKTFTRPAVTEHRYVPTERGRQFLTTFLERYQEYMKLYDSYCAVDLEGDKKDVEGNVIESAFAFNRYFELSPDDLQAYLQDERWEDLRVAVAEFKKYRNPKSSIDPVEIVFMSFLNEGHIDIAQPDWGAQLVSDELWDEILRICNTNLSWKELGYKDPETGKNIPAEGVIRDIIRQGTELMFELHRQEEELKQAQAAETAEGTTNEEVVEEVVMERVVVDPYPIAYYYPYRDPYYISPVWIVPLLLL